MYNVCRAFTLYNDSALPGNTEANQENMYLFGYYDGISVSRNLFEDVNGKYTFNFYGHIVIICLIRQMERIFHR